MFRNYGPYCGWKVECEEDEADCGNRDYDLCFRDESHYSDWVDQINAAATKLPGGRRQGARGGDGDAIKPKPRRRGRGGKGKDD